MSEMRNRCIDQEVLVFGNEKQVSRWICRQEHRLRTPVVGWSMTVCISSVLALCLVSSTSRENPLDLYLLNAALSDRMWHKMTRMETTLEMTWHVIHMKLHEGTEFSAELWNVKVLSVWCFLLMYEVKVCDDIPTKLLDILCFTGESDKVSLIVGVVFGVLLALGALILGFFIFKRYCTV